MANNNQSRTARRKQAKEQKKQKKPLWKKIWRIALLVFLISIISVGVVFSYFIATAPDIDADLLSDPASTKLYDINGEVFADLGSEKRTQIDYNEISPVLLNAVIATEDARFFDHMGIDVRRIGAAVIANFQDGFGSQGASTITQQVVKGSFLSNDKKIKRKVQEQWLALKLDREYSKEEIMEMYLNKIYYGSGAYGVAKASEIYFGKTNLNDLTLAEAALLAGLPQRPSAYDPFKNPDLAQERMNTVLSLMVHHNKITEEEAEEARNVDVTSLLTNRKPEGIKYEAFIQQVEDEVREKTGADIYKDSLQVYTTIDPDAQTHVELLLSDSEENPIAYPDDELQVGLSVVDTQSGAIKAIGGGRNRGNNGWNYAIDNENRQPGSTIKPITAYGPAIEYLKWSTYHQLNDDKAYEVGGSTPIKNWNKDFQGWVTARYALEQSLNVPAVKTLEEVGYSDAQAFAEGLGIDFTDDQMTIRDAIGGTQNGVSSLQLAGAYAAFGNEGVYHEPYSVKEIVYPDNRTEELVSEAVSAMSDYTAYMITDMLKSVVQEGTGTMANVSNLPMAGKTGTTSMDSGPGSPDSWFSGYTSNFTIAVWTGYDDPTKAIPDTKVSQRIFKETMTKISEGIETADFTQPDSVVELEVEKGSNPAKRPSEYTPSSQIVTELFVKGNEPDDTSEKFDKLEPVQNLEASYVEDEELIAIQWNYEEDEDVAFKVSAGTNGNLSELTTTENKELTIENVEAGETYTIEVVVVNTENDSLTSEASQVEVSIPDDEQEIEAIQSLTHDYNENENSVLISWGYGGDGPVEFEVSVNEAGSQIDQFNTNKKSVNISQLQNGRSYTIVVTPYFRNDTEIRGEGSSISFETAEAEEEETEEGNNEQQNEENNDTENNDDEEQQDPQQDEEQQQDDGEDTSTEDDTATEE
ncbi:transglycosylase domain-containing protein [Saliterribacillus persicus]|uniref:Penicillin-binding protein 1A n=1 Tax=Saliterribacillus persicus TaxID=930114 RepID=A0A368XAR8_9BACI|nr:PBP1A family penicillin-binding protein [Saliterribacillus persicus]RCW64945.1 penicillin-binding protein 1A [Saliterribacillus persicus]